MGHNQESTARTSKSHTTSTSTARSMKHVVCFSGGHSSALVAIEVVRRYGRESVILLNHDINPEMEDFDIKRFKDEVAAYLGKAITYANFSGCSDPNEIPTQFDVCEERGAFKQPGTGSALCTHWLKTEPFERFLLECCEPNNTTAYYGFDDDEQARMARRNKELNPAGWLTCYPLADWPSTIESTEEIGITRPATYSVFKHGNCVGCLKGGLKHWYVTFCVRPDVWERAKLSEERLGYSINSDQRTSPRKPQYLKDLEPVFAAMKAGNVPQTEHSSDGKFNSWLKRFRLEGSDKGGCRRCMF